VKAAVARTVHVVNFGDTSAPPRTQAATGRVQRVARILALAHKIEAMIRAGELRDLADAARRLSLTRARISQISNLLLLAPDIQESILGLLPTTKGRDPVSERALRRIVGEPDWERQRKLWDEVKP
jgi:hypothetical protein